MSHQPPVPPQPEAAAEAYRQGYLQGHRAGWMDALAAQVKAAAPDSSARQGSASVLVPDSPVTQTPVTQAPVTQTPATQAPVTQVPAHVLGR